MTRPLMEMTPEESDPLELDPEPRQILPARHSVFVRESSWNVPVRLTIEEQVRLLRLLRSRDDCILILLGQHRYLTTEHLEALFFPSRRAAQKRLRWLAEERLVMRWRQVEPAAYGWRRRPSLYLLTRRGARIAASALGIDPQPLIKSSRLAMESIVHFGHNLEVNGFFVDLATAARERPGEGLYHWVGQDSLARGYQEERRRLTPDGWARYLFPDGEVVVTLEWDRATESPRVIAAKARAYLSYFADGSGINHVLFVAPAAGRELRIRVALGSVARRSRAQSRVRFWTSHVVRLRKYGPRGPIWWPLDSSDLTSGIDRFDRRPLQGNPVEHSIGKPRWWDYRPGGGEGA